MKKVKLKPSTTRSVKLTPSSTRKIEAYKAMQVLGAEPSKCGCVGIRHTCLSMSTKLPFQKNYSGNKSTEFWDRVNALPDDDRWNLYTAGVLLQNMEETIIQWLNNAERAALQSKKDWDK